MIKKIHKLKIIGTLTLILIALLIGQTFAAYYSISARPWAEDQNIYEILVDDFVVVRYRTIPNGYTAWERTKIILERLNSISTEGDLATGPIVAGKMNGYDVVLVNNKLLLTVTNIDSEANYMSTENLANIWARHFRESLEFLEAPKVSTQSFQQDEVKMLQLINEERAKEGKKPLVMDEELVKLARMKSQDMIENNYFSHTSPTYGSPFDMMKKYGVSYRTAGENLAGNQTVEKAHVALMNSPGHRANIMNDNFTHVGIGIVKGGVYGVMYTQMFIGK